MVSQTVASTSGVTRVWFFLRCGNLQLDRQHLKAKLAFMLGLVCTCRCMQCSRAVTRPPL
jgi:hypothetical protein